MSFTCDVSEESGVKVFTLAGRLMDQAEADSLTTALEREIENGHSNIVLELSELKYMNSTGLNIMINVLTKTRNACGEAVITNVSENVKQLFVVTKLDTIFTIVASKEEAIERLSA